MDGRRETLFGWLSRRLSRRIVALFLGLLLAVQALSFLATRESVSRNAREQIAQELQLGERVFRRLLTQNAQKLSDGATLLAADYGFRSAVATNDTDTIGSVLLNHGERIGASIALLLDTRFALRAAGQQEASALMPAVHRLAERTAFGMSHRPASEIVALGGRAYQLVMVPLRAPLVIGWVVMGFDIDTTLVRDMREITALQTSLLVRPDDSGAWRIGATTLALDQAAPLAAMDWGGDDAPAAVQRASVRVDGEEFSARSVVLNPDGGGSVRTLLMRSVDEAVAPYRQHQLVMAMLTLLGVAVFAAGSVFTARRITTPVRALVRAAERLGRGDYQSPVQVHSRDEIGELAQAFEHMRVSVDAQQREITRLAYWDSLTGLPNRTQFRDVAAAALSAPASAPAAPVDGHHRGGSPGQVSVLMLDMDRFKHVNDVLGYEIGDRMLQQVAQRLSQVCVRQGSLVARLSGDEFAVLLPATDARDAMAMAGRVAAAFEAPLVLDDQTIDLRASVGVATSPEHAQDADTLLSRAEVAMYAAKRRGAGALAYDPAFDSGSARTISLLSGLRRAVDHGELHLVLQPKVALDTAAVEGAEALVRWQHPERGLMAPGQFIALAEETGLIVPLSEWVLDSALGFLASCRDQGLALLPVSVNLSAAQFRSEKLVADLALRLARHGLPGHLLEIEVTESILMKDVDLAAALFSAISEQGIQISIDDFGTGYSSLAYLKRFQVDTLKIDRSFVRDLENGSGDAAIVGAVIALAQNLGMGVIAEGVEERSQMEILMERGCTLMQGYYFARPLPEDAYRDVLLQGLPRPHQAV